METKRGGARSGAGRKKGEPTTRISVPVSMLPEIRALIRKRKIVKGFTEAFKILQGHYASTPENTDDPLNGRD